MKTVLIAVGSRGDVLPHVHLAQRLILAGGEAVVATTDDQLPLALDAGVPAVSIAPGMRFAGGAQVRDASRRARFESPLGTLSELRGLMQGLAEPAARVLDELVDTGDSVLHGVLTAGAAVGLAATRDCRVAQVTFAASVPTAYGNSYIAAPLPSRVSRLNLAASRTAHRFFVALSLPPGRAIARAHGHEINAAALNRQVLANPTLVATSPLLAPPAPDWSSRVVVTGAWTSTSANPDIELGVPADLREFIDAGPAPIYIGFGSAVARDPVDDLLTLADAAKSAGVRAVIRRSDWLSEPTPDSLGSNVHVVDTVPHEWLFPRMAGVIHHGGAGTTNAALRAAVPSSIVWHNVDQPFHARRSADLGVGPLGFAKRRLTIERLAHLITELTGPHAEDYRQRASEAAAHLAREDGISRAVDALNGWQLI